MKIFLIIFDTLRKDHTGKSYENKWIQTPHFDNFAKDSIVFDKAYPEALPTIPQRRGVHTGIRTFPFNHNKPKLRTDDYVSDPGWNPIPPHHKQIAEYMKDQKYISSFITSTYHQFKPNMNFHLGFDQWNWIRGHEVDKVRALMRMSKKEFKDLLDEHCIEKKQGRMPYRYQQFMLRHHFPNIQDRNKEVDYFPGQTFTKAIEFIRDAKNIENVFSLIDEFDPHEPWDPPQKYLDLYADPSYEGKKMIQPMYSLNLKYLKDDELKYMRACYAGEVSMCDHWFGEFITELKTLELYEDSLIMLISDHGHSIGEHNATGKIPNYMYPELVDIPFMIKPSGGLSGPKRISKSYVYNHDILPTIFGFLDVEKPDIFNGEDLSVFLNEDDHLITNRDYITCGFSLCSLFKDDHYALITTNDKKHQKLFDLHKDPDWDIDIAEDNKDICEELFEKIERDAGYDLLQSEEQISFEELKDWYYMREAQK